MEEEHSMSRFLYLPMYGVFRPSCAAGGGKGGGGTNKGEEKKKIV